ncbi:hypothetical protein ACQCSX_06050 [Pseudarthrobacter sp. P1]|uniref:hypothetical protein n=1 Tax=Pseudarthrobacter sp. P1 TaxID=3418418 RepID=UPI003CED3DDE
MLDQPLRSPLDKRALRFAIGFPLALALAFFAAGFTFHNEVPQGVVLPTGGYPLALPAYLAVGAGAIALAGVGISSQGARTVLPRLLRRIVMGAGMSIQLTIAALFASALAAQAGTSEAPSQRLDATVLAMGSGAAVALGVTLAMSFKPDEQWTRADDAELGRVLDPALAADSVEYWVHPRSSVVIMILLLGILPAMFLGLLSPWLGVASVAAALIAIGALSALVTADRSGVKVRLAGLLPVMGAACVDMDAAVALNVSAGRHGGWGLRHHSGSASFLAASGAAVVVRLNDSTSLVIGAPNLDTADVLEALLNRRAGKRP